MRLRLPCLHSFIFFFFVVLALRRSQRCIETSWKLEKFPLVSRENSRRWLPDKKRHAVEMQISVLLVEKQ